MVTELQLGRTPELLSIVYGPQMDPLADQVPEFHQVGSPPVEPAVQLAEKLPDDWHARLRAAHFIKRVALDDVYIDPAASEAPNTSLKKSLERSLDGDIEAGKSAWMNTHIAVVEAVLKNGHITQVEMTRNQDGHWLQHGAAMLHVFANALRTEIVRKHPGLMARSEAETVNGYRAEELGQSGTLENKYLFVPSLFPEEDEVSFDVATKEAGFFGDTKTAALQLSSTDGEEAHIETAFVIGLDKKTGARVDLEVMHTIYFLNGIDTTGWKPIDFLSNPLVIDKERLPNGAADLYDLYNKIAADVAGHQIADPIDPTSFGAECREREQNLEVVTGRVMNQLKAKAPELTDDEDAVRLLAKLVGPAVVEHVILDSSFDSGVFGEEAALHIEAARAHHAAGNFDLAQQAIQAARETAVVTMCGVTTSLNEEQLKEAAMNALRGQVTNTESDESDDCEYMSKECPLCHTKNVLTKSTKTKIEGDCGCWLDKVSSKAHVSAKPNIAARRNNAHLN